jgi:hypothetical protein
MARAPSAASAQLCPASATEDFAFVGIGAGGARLGTVTVTLSETADCASTLTNGTAARYGWTPPPDLKSRLFALTPNTHPLSPAATPTK